MYGQNLTSQISMIHRGQSCRLTGWSVSLIPSNLNHTWRFPPWHTPCTAVITIEIWPWIIISELTIHYCTWPGMFIPSKCSIHSIDICQTTSNSLLVSKYTTSIKSSDPLPLMLPQKWARHCLPGLEEAWSHNPATNKQVVMCHQSWLKLWSFVQNKNTKLSRFHCNYIFVPFMFYAMRKTNITVEI